VNQRVSDEAVDWFVLNESGQDGGKFGEARWALWQRNALHQREYVRVVEFVEEVRLAGPPESVSGTSLRKDAEDDE
jgi:ferric-dicitrate binding protein FerR (iron transport regulator)